MSTLWGIGVMVFTLLCWIGQIINAAAPKRAARWGLTEPESDVDPTFYAEGRAEAAWDAASLWPLPVAAVLLVLDHPWWPYFGLVGGGIYLYFAGRGIAVRLFMQRRGIRIGKPKTVAMCHAFLLLWGAMALVTVMMAVRALAQPS